MKRFLDRIVCACTPEPFDAVGLWYEVFTQVEDSEVQALFAAARGRIRSAPPASRDAEHLHR
jgi:predicted phosphoribosyltransferase